MVPAAAVSAGRSALVSTLGSATSVSVSDSEAASLSQSLQVVTVTVRAVRVAVVSSGLNVTVPVAPT